MSTQAPKTITLRSALLMAGASAAVCAAFFAGVLAARATPGGPTREYLSFSGSLLNGNAPATGKWDLTFALAKSNNVKCAPPAIPQVLLDAGGGFTAEIYIHDCPAFFDGDDVTFAVTAVQGMTTVTAMGAINPVPYAKYADQYGSPDCPVGYVFKGSAGPVGSKLCVRRADEVVKVGTGASAFWIDRYEATLWDDISKAPGSKANVFEDASMATGFPANGQWTTPYYALSVGAPGWEPTARVTWFQAAAACRLSGKRLPTDEEWGFAATGTPDPAMADDGTKNGECVTNAQGLRSNGAAWVMGSPTACISAWGAQDMIGNAAEWTASWYAGLGAANVSSTWPGGPDFGGDGTNNITSSARYGGGMAGIGLPAAALRGGNYGDGVHAGVFALNLNESPNFAPSSYGFRCVIPR